MRRGSAFVRDVGTQAAGNYISALLRVVRGFAVAALLGPASMGIVAVGNLVTNYGQYADLGVGQAVGREIPMALGRGDSQEAAALAWYGILARLLGGVLVTGATILWALSTWAASEPIELKLVLVLSALSIVAAGEMMMLQTIGCSHGRFTEAARIGVVFAVFNLAGGVGGAYYGGSVGATIGGVLAATISTVYGWWKLKPAGYLGIDRARLMALVRLGVPLALLLFMSFNLENIDQVMILGLLNRTALGLYAIVLQAGSLISLMGLSVSSVIGPRLLKRFAQHGTTESIRELTWKPAVALSALMPTLVCLAWLLGPWFIVWLLPKYVLSIAPFKIYMTAMYFLVLNLGVSSTLLALNKHRRNIPIMLSCIALNVCVDLVLVGVFKMGLPGVAFGSLITYIVYWVLYAGLVRWYFERSFLSVARLNIALVWPGLLLLLFLGVSALLGTIGKPTIVLDSVFTCLAVCAGVVQTRELWPDLWALIRRADE
jgi:O-antigen/teichoic acid export membrane protein